MKHLSRARPSGVIAFMALFIAMSGIAVADNDGTVNGSKINVGKGDIGLKEISKKAKNALKGQTGAPGAPGTPGSGGGDGGNAPTNSFTYRVDAPADNKVILVGNGFQLRASAPSSASVPCPVFLDSTADNNAFTQFGHRWESAMPGPPPSVEGGAIHTLAMHDPDFDVADGDQMVVSASADINAMNVLNIRPLTGAVTTVHYTVDVDEQGFDCNITGTSVTQG